MNKHFSLSIFGSTILLLTSSLLAAPGTLDQTPLYVGPAVEPNIVILSDDSGSMDWEVMTSGNNGWFYSNQPNGTNDGTSGSIKVRDPNGTDAGDCDVFGAPYDNGGLYLYGVRFRNNTDMLWADWNCFVADDEAWRFRNSDFNPLYFDPAKTYLPWAGVNKAGVAYSDAPVTAAPNNPYDPTETINLLTEGSGITGETWDGSKWVGGTRNTLAGGFRYYDWNDTDGDGLFDNGEETEHQLNSESAAIQQNFANWFAYHRSREFVAKYAMSQALKDITGARVGYGAINDNNNTKVKVESMNINPADGNKRALFDNLYNTHSTGGTPLRTNLRDVGRYIECDGSNFFGVSGADCPILPASEYGMCQKNFSILMTDGFRNGAAPNIDGIGDSGDDEPDGTINTGDNADGNNSTAFDGGDYADNLADTLADVAMHYYERDLSTLANEVPASGIDTATHQHMTTFTVAFGVTGTLDPDGTKTPSDATDTNPADPGFSWPSSIPNNSLETIDDLWHTAFNGRGAFFSAQDPDTLISALSNAIESATKGTSSSAAVAFNTTSLDTDSVVYQALFNPTEDWKGELIATKLNADGTLANSPKWNTGDQLNNKAHASREIITYKVDATPANSTGIAFKTLTDLSATQQADLNMGPSAADGNGQARLDYLRGDRSNESKGLFFRNRTNVLGDIVHSNPVFVGKPQMSYPESAPFGDATNLYSTFKTANTNRTGLIYIGANDGMLHAFHEDTGDEVFAYMPSLLFSSATGTGLHYLTDPGYTHRYYVDLSPTVTDVFYTRDSVTAWRTVLVGGLRAGGRGLFALDITDPTVLANADSATNAAKTVLWEFTSADDADLGYTMSKPTIAMMENGEWGVVFGNGYNGSGDGEAKLFILYLDQGFDGEWALADYKKITTGVGTVGTPNGLSTPQLVDIDGNGKVDRAYAGDLEGNLWAFDLSATSANTWKVAYKQGTTVKPLFTATDSGGTPQPITSKPVVANQLQNITNPGNPNLMVFFGTGQYIVSGDKTSTGSQTFYGIWDDGTKERTRSHLLAQTFTADTTSENRIVTDTAITYGTNHGWLIDLPTSGERIVVNPKIRGKYVFFNTLIPGLELCVPEGSGWVMAVKQENGGQPGEAIFDINNDGVIDANDQVNGSNPSGFKLDGIPAASTFLGDVMYTPNDEGTIDARKISVGGGGNGGRLSWQELTQ